MTSQRTTRRHRPTRRHLSVSVVTALAVTLGAGVLAAPAAGAVTAAAQAAQAVDEPVTISPDRWVLGGGEHGFYSIDGSNYGNQDPTFDHLTFTRYADGTVTDLGLMTAEDMPHVTGDFGTLVKAFSSSVSLFDGATGTLTTVPLDAETHFDLRAVGVAGKGLFGYTDATLKYYTAEGAREVTGLPADHPYPEVLAATDTQAVILTKDGNTKVSYWAVVDLATAKTVRSYAVPAGADPASLAFTDTRMAWVEYALDDTAKVTVRERATDNTLTTVIAGKVPGRGVETALIGDWVTYGRPGGLTATAPASSHALTAVRVSTGAKVRLLDHFARTPYPSGIRTGLVMRGGSLAEGARGEGVYRIAAGSDGVPKAVLEATTNVATGLRTGSTVLPHQGETLRPDAVPGGAPTRFGFTLNHCNAKVDAVLRHSSGKTFRKTWTRTASQDWCQNVVLDWEHYLDAGDGRHAGAPSGGYTATFTFTPMNGIGPAATVSGSFQVERAKGQHDFDRNADPDFFARDASGVLWTDSTVMTSTGELNAPTRRIGGGWQAYDRIESAGGQTLVARDKTGGLWYYPGDGNGGTGARKAVGGGWQVYDKLAGGSDLNGDGRADLLATDKAGVLWYYKGTGNSAAPFTGKTRIGGGWGKFNQITATGDLAGGTAGDLVARDGDGVLWLYLGKGDGTFTAPTRIGDGWNAYAEIVAGGDANHNGKADLFAYDAREKKVYFYGGTGDRARPFVTRKATTVFTGNAYDHIA
ncbi:FG-GAP repeat domain-containing protein [Streptomyces hydrogenans]|uniref:FG-GAP repeat domain-containing protein n=1 Tax=Streptomyces hydrogenans TaxID=1873719 RepID=UPI00278BBB16|nr:VCBS repeat-containing protein [Streptomyces hydrogenans]